MNACPSQFFPYRPGLFSSPVTVDCGTTAPHRNQSAFSMFSVPFKCWENFENVEIALTLKVYVIWRSKSVHTVKSVIFSDVRWEKAMPIF